MKPKLKLRISAKNDFYDFVKCAMPIYATWDGVHRVIIGYDNEWPWK